MFTCAQISPIASVGLLTINSLPERDQLFFFQFFLNLQFDFLLFNVSDVCFQTVVILFQLPNYFLFGL